MIITLHPIAAVAVAVLALCWVYSAMFNTRERTQHARVLISVKV